MSQALFWLNFLVYRLFGLEGLVVVSRSIQFSTSDGVELDKSGGLMGRSSSP